VTQQQSEAPTEPADSSYSLWDGEALVRTDDGAINPLAERVHSALRAVILDPEFPCVGARSAMNRGSYRFAMYDELDSEGATEALARDLGTFVAEGPSIEGDYTTFITVFDGPKVIEPVEFEHLLWSQLRRLHDLDDAPWDPTVSSDPDAPTFSFSFAGQAFFIVGLSPTGDRWARRFPWPLLAFNPHEQFERLRASGQFERIQEVVRDRDEQLEGDLNPNLADFGSHTEARQYSGRPVEDDWRCPVRFD
jgi:FPC/CPF motif-containing protein YcgG